MLVAVAVLVSLVFAAWLFFGEVARSVTVDGVLVESGGNPSGNNRTLRAVVWLERDAARQIEAGMAAAVEVVSTGGEEYSFDGEISAFTTAADSGWPELFEAVAPAAMHRVEITLAEDFDIAAPDVAECRIVIELGRQSPISLSGLGSS